MINIGSFVKLATAIHMVRLLRLYIAKINNNNLTQVTERNYVNFLALFPPDGLWKTTRMFFYYVWK